MERRTTQREAICRAFEATERPLSAKEVQDLAQASVPSIGIATVYRQLKRLVEDGWLREVELPGSTGHFELAHHDHHHHFHCEACGRVFDVHGCTKAIESNIPEGFEVARHEVILYGRCSDCTEAA